MRRILSFVLVLSLTLPLPVYSQDIDKKEALAVELAFQLSRLKTYYQKPLGKSSIFEILSSYEESKDIRNILLKRESFTMNWDSQATHDLRVTQTNTSRQKFIQIARRIALTKAIDSLFLYQSLIHGRERRHFISSELRDKISEQYSGLGDFLEMYISVHEDFDETEWQTLQEAALKSLILKGMSVGALEQRVEELDGELNILQASLKEASISERESIDIDILEKQKMRYALLVEIDSQLAESSSYSLLTEKVQVHGDRSEKSLSLFLREFHDIQIYNLGVLDFEHESYEKIKEQLEVFLQERLPQYVSDIESFIEALFDREEEAIAPLIALRQSTIQRIDEEVKQLKEENLYNQDLPSIEDYELVSHKLGRRYGFDVDRYNTMTTAEMMRVFLTSLTLAQAAKWTSKNVRWGNSWKTLARNKSNRVFHRLGRRGAAWLAKWLGGPLVVAGFTAVELNDLRNWIRKSNYREFLKGYLTSGHKAGIVPYEYAKFASEYDNTDITWMAVASAIATYVLFRRYKNFSINKKIRPVGEWGRNLFRLGRGFLRGHQQAVRQIITTRSKNVLANGALRLKKGLELRMNGVWLGKQLTNLSIVAASVGIMMNVHYNRAGFGHVTSAIYRSARNAFTTESTFMEEMWDTFARVYFDNKQAYMDLVSVSVADTIITMGSNSPINISSVTSGGITPAASGKILSHRYGSVGFLGEIFSQYFAQQKIDPFDSQSDNQKKRWGVLDEITWERPLFHYAFSASFGYLKYMHAFVPIRNRMLRPYMQRIIKDRRIPLNVSNKALPFAALHLSENKLKSYGIWSLTNFVLSLGSSAIGNTSFVESISNLKDVLNNNRALRESLIERVETGLAEQNLEYTESVLEDLVNQVKVFADEAEKNMPFIEDYLEESLDSAINENSP